MPDNRTLDLHGLIWDEALAAFVAFYNDARRQSGGKLDVVHGYGSTGTGGVLRQRLRAFLQKNNDRLEFFPGEQVDGNPGHTVIVPLKPLPSASDTLAEQVWSYCASPKSLEKITGEFRKFGQPEVLRAVRELEGQRRLRTVVKGAHKLYQAV